MVEMRHTHPSEGNVLKLSSSIHFSGPPFTALQNVLVQRARAIVQVIEEAPDEESVKTGALLAADGMLGRSGLGLDETRRGRGWLRLGSLFAEEDEWGSQQN